MNGRFAKCPSCGRQDYFIVTIVQKRKKYYRLTQCPKCKMHDDIVRLTEEETADLRKYNINEGGVSHENTN